MAHGYSRAPTDTTLLLLLLLLLAALAAAAAAACQLLLLAAVPASAAAAAAAAAVSRAAAATATQRGFLAQYDRLFLPLAPFKNSPGCRLTAAELLQPPCNLPNISRKNVFGHGSSDALPRYRLGSADI